MRYTNLNLGEIGRRGFGRRAVVFPILLTGLLLPPSLLPAGVPTFYPVEGFEESVKPVVSPDREILVVPAESEDGSSASIQTYDLDPNTGAVIGLVDFESSLGWENGVTPIVVKMGIRYVVIVPEETEDGSAARVKVLQVDAGGIITNETWIPLGNLGFQDDVDPILTYYTHTAVVVPVETEDGSASGVLAIKLNGVTGFDSCVLVSSDVRATPPCQNVTDPLLTGFVDGVDGVGYQLIDRARFAIPLRPATATSTGDLGFFDFDLLPSPLIYDGSQSVKATNALGPRPVPFPGFERDVDMALLAEPTVGCSFPNAPCPLLVPVEDPSGNSGDLYVINGRTGETTWRYNLENVGAFPPVLGYEEAVDVVTWTSVNPPLVAVPAENRNGNDADLLLVNLDTGIFQASVERANAGYTVMGYEKGVEPLLWGPSFMVVPLDDEHGKAGMISINAGAIIQASVPSGSIMGFERSVDPATLPLSKFDRTLYVPVERQDQSDADLLIFPGPPPSLAGAVSFEARNPGTTVEGYERDVDPILADRYDGPRFLYVPEEKADGSLARLRVQEFPFSPLGPGSGILMLPTEGTGAIPANLYYVDPLGFNLEVHPDVYGYELGLGPTSAHGDTMAPNPPFPESQPLGYASDEDNTLTMENSYDADLDGDGRSGSQDCAPREGGVWAAPTAVAGLIPDTLGAGTTLNWTSQDGIAGPDTSYDIATGLVSELKTDGNFQRASCLATDVADTPAFDFRLPPLKDAFYWIARAQNLCGTATWGKPDLDTASPCP